MTHDLRGWVLICKTHILKTPPFLIRLSGRRKTEPTRVILRRGSHCTESGEPTRIDSLTPPRTIGESTVKT